MKLTDSTFSAPEAERPTVPARHGLIAAPSRTIRPETFGFTLVLGLLGALPPLAIDISAPTLIVVRSQLDTSTRMVGLVITLFMLGFAIGQFAGGPMSDRHGRRPVLLIGLLGYTTASIGCALSGSIGELLFWRLIQGLGAGACAVLTFAMIRDLFEGDQARAKRSYVTVVFGVAPMLAPLLGAWILDHLGWRMVYLGLSVGGFALLLAVTLGVQESRVAVAGTAPRALMQAYRGVLSQRHFMCLVLVNALSFAGIFAYIAGGPLVLMGLLSLTPTEYGQVFACTAATLTAGAWISGRCAQAGIGCRALLWAGLLLGAGAACWLGVLLVLGSNQLMPLLPPLLLGLLARGLVAPNVQHMALEPMREHAGTAAAALGVIQIVSGVLSSACVALLLPVLGGGAMGLVMALGGGLALLVWAALPAMAPPTTA